MSLAEALKTAIAHHRAGRIQEAERCYRQILEVAPEDPDALHGVGVIAYQSGRHAAALDWIGRAVAARPGSMAFVSNLGLTCQAMRRFGEAEAAFRRAIALAPTVSEPHFNLGNALKELGRREPAIAAYQQALALQPSHASALNNLGNTLRDLGRLDEALRPLKRAIALRPDYAAAYTNLGNVLRDLGRALEAEACCRRALQLQPDFAVAHNNLGNALRDLGKKEESAASYRRATELDPRFAEAHRNLGEALLQLERLGEALVHFRQAVALRPDQAEGFRSLGNALFHQKQLEEGDACYSRALELEPDAADGHSAWLYWRQYRPGTTLASLAADHADWNRRHGLPSAIPSSPRRGVPRRPLRLGFVSDFGRHPLGYFSLRTLEALPRDEFTVVCYSIAFHNDDFNARFRARADLWREVRPLNDEFLDKRIREDAIDILFDLCGHSGGNRLPVFARKPAPVQITWIGSEGTTGLSAIDYLLADDRMVPPAAEPFYSERILRLPETYVTYEPPYALDVAPPPALKQGRITFGCFNNPAKLNPEVAAAWSQILVRVPGSRLLLKYRHLTDPALQSRIAALFADNGASPDRLRFEGWSPHVEMLAEYHDVDVALDPFPFAGGGTTCEALWMGVPVVTWPGSTFAGRHSLSYLTTIGLTELVADDRDGYVDLAVELATDLPRLTALRAGLRDRMSASPLLDGPRLARFLGALLREIWDG